MNRMSTNQSLESFSPMTDHRSWQEQDWVVPPCRQTKVLLLSVRQPPQTLQRVVMGPDTAMLAVRLLTQCWQLQAQQATTNKRVRKKHLHPSLSAPRHHSVTSNSFMRMQKIITYGESEAKHIWSNAGDKVGFVSCLDLITRNFSCQFFWSWSVKAQHECYEKARCSNVT